MTTDATRPLLTDLSPPPRSRGRRGWYVAGVVALVALVVAAFVLLRSDDDSPDVATPATSPSASATTSPGASASPSPSAQVPGTTVDRSTAVWPYAGSGVSYDDPKEAARGFATDFLGMVSPVVGDFLQGDSRSGEVEVRPRATGPVTTVLVRQLSGEDAWSVLGSTTGNIDVTQPEASAVVSSPVTVRGSSVAFEATVNVEVRQDGDVDPIGEGIVMGGGDSMQPFEGSIPFSAPTADRGALVLFTQSAENGQVWEAAVLRVQLRGGGTSAPVACTAPGAEQPGAGEMAVTVFFTCDPGGEAVPDAEPVIRVVPASAGVLRASMTALLAGPTAQESEAGFTSFFSSATAGLLRDVTLSDGHAVVDFGDLPSVIPNASTSAGSALLLSELDATVFQFSTVQSAEYRVDGSCTAFTEWLQVGGCAPRQRP